MPWLNGKVGRLSEPGRGALTYDTVRRLAVGRDSMEVRRDARQWDAAGFAELVPATA
jgi:hypothetical protein